MTSVRELVEKAIDEAVRELTAELLTELTRLGRPTVKEIAERLRRKLLQHLDVAELCRAAGLDPDERVVLVLRSAHTNWHMAVHRGAGEKLVLEDSNRDVMVFRKYVIEYQGNDEGDIAHTKLYGGYFMFMRYDPKKDKLEQVNIPEIAAEILREIHRRLPDAIKRVLDSLEAQLRDKREVLWKIQDLREELSKADLQALLNVAEFFRRALWEIGHDSAVNIIAVVPARDALKLALAIGLCLVYVFRDLYNKLYDNMASFRYTSNAEAVRMHGGFAHATIYDDGRPLYEAEGGRAIGFAKYLVNEGLVEKRDLLLSLAVLLYTDAFFGENNILPHLLSDLTELGLKEAEKLFRTDPVKYTRILRTLLGAHESKTKTTLTLKTAI